MEPGIREARRLAVIEYYATQHLMALFPDRCRRIVEVNAKQGNAVAGDAGMHLHALDIGFYKPRLANCG
jgi:hypothetical protein